MKAKPTLLLSLILATPSLLLAGMVPAHQVPREAQWLIHLDVVEIRQSAIGSRLIKTLVESRKLEFGDPIPVNFATVINGLDSITLYGTSLDLNGGIPMAITDGVASLRGSPQFITVLQGIIAAAELERPDAVTLVEESPRRIFLFPGEIFGSIVSDTTIAVSKSREGLKTFFSTLNGGHANAEGASLLETLGAGGEGFFFAVAVEGINSFPAHALPQASVLQMTEGIAVWFGEAGGLLQLNISLRVDGTETAVRVQQVLQGIIALASLAQIEHPELQQVLQSVRVVSEGRNVRLDLSYPSEEALKWVDMLADGLSMSVTIN